MRIALPLIGLIISPFVSPFHWPFWATLFTIYFVRVFMREMGEFLNTELVPPQDYYWSDIYGDLTRNSNGGRWQIPKEK